jgi:hypothetical protein
VGSLIGKIRMAVGIKHIEVGFMRGSVKLSYGQGSNYNIKMVSGSNSIIQT